MKFQLILLFIITSIPLFSQNDFIPGHSELVLVSDDYSQERFDLALEKGEVTRFGKIDSIKTDSCLILFSADGSFEYRLQIEVHYLDRVHLMNIPYNYSEAATIRDQVLKSILLFKYNNALSFNFTLNNKKLIGWQDEGRLIHKPDLENQEFIYTFKSFNKGKTWEVSREITEL